MAGPRAAGQYRATGSRRKAPTAPPDEGEMGAPEALADLAVVEVEPPQDAAALHAAHGFLRQAQPLGDRSHVCERHEA